MDEPVQSRWARWKAGGAQNLYLHKLLYLVGRPYERLAFLRSRLPARLAYPDDDSVSQEDFHQDLSLGSTDLPLEFVCGLSYQAVARTGCPLGLAGP